MQLKVFELFERFYLVLLVTQDALKRSVLDLLTSKGKKTELQLGFRFCMGLLWALFLGTFSLFSSWLTSNSSILMSLC